MSETREERLKNRGLWLRGHYSGFKLGVKKTVEALENAPEPDPVSLEAVEEQVIQEREDLCKGNEDIFWKDD